MPPVDSVESIIIQREGGTIAAVGVKDKANTLTVFVKAGNLPQVADLPAFLGVIS